MVRVQLLGKGLHHLVKGLHAHVLTLGIDLAPPLEHLGQAGHCGVVQLQVLCRIVESIMEDKGGSLAEVPSLYVTGTLNGEHGYTARDGDTALRGGGGGGVTGTLNGEHGHTARDGDTALRGGGGEGGRSHRDTQWGAWPHCQGWRHSPAGRGRGRGEESQGRSMGSMGTLPGMETQP